MLEYRPCVPLLVLFNKSLKPMKIVMLPTNILAICTFIKPLLCCSYPQHLGVPSWLENWLLSYIVATRHCCRWCANNSWLRWWGDCLTRWVNGSPWVMGPEMQHLVISVLHMLSCTPRPVTWLLTLLDTYSYVKRYLNYSVESRS